MGPQVEDGEERQIPLSPVVNFVRSFFMGTEVKEKLVSLSERVDFSNGCRSTQFFMAYNDYEI